MVSRAVRHASTLARERQGRGKSHAWGGARAGTIRSRNRPRAAVAVTRPLRIGCGAGFAGDRLEPALELVERAAVDVLILECLGERTIALAQQDRLADPARGFDPLLLRRMEMLLPVTAARGTRLLTNAGAAHPRAGAEAVAALAARLGLAPRIVAVLGDDVRDLLTPDMALDDGGRLGDLGEIVSANAYLGAEPLRDALALGADIVISGRVADPSLTLAPLMHRFGWAAEDWTLMGRGTAIGHLLECAGQLTGGYFAEPGRKEVPDLARLGFPFADVWPDGRAVFGKPEGSGGRLSLATAKEQLLYEVLDPTAYLTPDASADFTALDLAACGPDRVALNGGGGGPRPDRLKVSVGYRAGHIGEGEISYAGPGAEARARLAGEIVRARLAGALDEIRVDLIGIDSTHGRSYGNRPEAYEARLRVAGRARDAARAARVGEEVEALYTNGPAGGGGARKYLRAVIGIASTYLPRARVVPRLEEIRA